MLRLRTEPAKDFNELLSRSVSKTTPKDFHFDIRVIAELPGNSPHHALLLFNPAGGPNCRIDQIPLTYRLAGSTYFPETPQAAAPAIAEGILKGFVLGCNSIYELGVNQVPRKLSTYDNGLAVAVGNELRRLGISEELCDISVTEKDILHDANVHFSDYMRTLVGDVLPEKAVSGYVKRMKPPLGVEFSTAIPLFPPCHLHNDNFTIDLQRVYCRAIWYASPHTLNSTLPRDDEALMKDSHSLLRKTEAEIKIKAEDGIIEAVIDYGLRQYIGLEGPSNRTLAHEYWSRVTTSTAASTEQACIAHALLFDWHIQGNSPSLRYLYFASYHAEKAIELGRLSHEDHFPPMVTAYNHIVFLFMAYLGPLARVLYPNVLAVVGADIERKRKKGEKAARKRFNNPNRYRCANVGCGVETDRGKLLRRCGGECDDDKKPSYCTAECQEEDWKAHRPFCKSGMPCSVRDCPSPEAFAAQAFPLSKKGFLRFPLTSGEAVNVLASPLVDRRIDLN